LEEGRRGERRETLSFPPKGTFFKCRGERDFRRRKNQALLRRGEGEEEAYLQRGSYLCEGEASYWGKGKESLFRMERKEEKGGGT